MTDWNEDGLNFAMQEYVRHTIDPDVPLSSLSPDSYSAIKKAVQSILNGYEAGCVMGQEFDELLGIKP